MVFKAILVFCLLWFWGFSFKCHRTSKYSWIKNGCQWQLFQFQKNFLPTYFSCAKMWKIYCLYTYIELKPFFLKLTRYLFIHRVNEVLSSLIWHHFNLREIDLSACAWKLTKDSVVPCQKFTMPFPWNPSGCFWMPDITYITNRALRVLVQVNKLGRTCKRYQSACC